MRKILSLVLVLALVLGSFPAFAAANVNEVGMKLKDLGVIKGDKNGNLMADQKLTREQAIVVLVRMMGAEDEAKATTVTSSFTDVKATNYYAPYIAYAELKGWTKGIGNGKFGFGLNVTTQQFTTYMLRALGYTTVPYDEAIAKATELGLLKDVVASQASAVLTRGDTFVMMHNALYSKPKDMEHELVYVLELAKLPVSATPEVVSVTTDNLKQIIIKFSAPLENAGDEKNYDLTTEKDGDAKLNKDSDFALSEDGKTVTITLTEAAKQQEKAELEITGIMKEDKTVDLYFLDLKIPEALKAEQIGNDTIKVYFSEPMKDGLTDKSNYTVKTADKGKKITVKSVTAANNGTEANVELYSKIDGDVVLSVEKVEDYQDYGIKGVDFDVTYVKDNEAPYVTGYKDATPYKVTLVFNQDIEINSKDKDDYYHTNSKDNVIEVPKVDGNELTLTFASYKDDDNKLPNGTAYIYIAKNAINDLWDNKNDKIAYTIEVTPDKDAPVVKKTEVTKQDELEVTFDEEIQKGDDFEVKIYKDNKKKKINLSSYIEGDDKDVLRVKFGEDLKGDYELVLEGVEDVYGNEASKITLDITFDDETAPDGKDFEVTLKSESDSKHAVIVVNFKEEMDSETIEDEDNYILIKNDAKKTRVALTDDDIEFNAINDNRGVEIKIVYADVKSVKDVDGVKATSGSVIGDTLWIGRVSDAAGNKMEQLSVEKEIKETGSSVQVDSVELVSNRMIEVTFKDKLSKISYDEFKLSIAGSEKTIDKKDISEELNSDGNTVLKFDFDEGQLDQTFTTNLEFKITDDAGHNEYGQKINGGTWDAAGSQSYTVDGKLYKRTFVDKAAPKIVEGYYVKSTTQGAIVVEFGEELDKNTFATATMNGFDLSDSIDIEKVRLGFDGSDANVNSKFVVLTVKEEDWQYINKEVFISYDPADGGAVKDRADNDLEKDTHKDDLKNETALNAAKK